MRENGSKCSCSSSKDYGVDDDDGDANGRSEKCVLKLAFIDRKRVERLPLPLLRNKREMRQTFNSINHFINNFTVY